MTPQEIIEGNTAIAFFMGAKEMSSTTTPQKVKTILSFIAYHNGNEVYCRNYEAGKSLKYHSSWDWLMPVVEKIETMNKVVRIEGYISEITSASNENPRVTPFKIYRHCKTKIEATWQAVTQFILWYNQTLSSHPVNHNENG